MTPAGRIQDYLKQKVQKRGGQYSKVKCEGLNVCPDCFVWWDGPCLAFIEIKAFGDRISTVQDREIERMRSSGVPVYIACSNEDIDEIIEKVQKGVATI